MAGKFEIYEDKSGQFRFRLKAGNGEVVATGESYPSRPGQRRVPKPCSVPLTGRQS